LVAIRRPCLPAASDISRVASQQADYTNPFLAIKTFSGEPGPRRAERGIARCQNCAWSHRPTAIRERRRAGPEQVATGPTVR
jgi:hypothetical protein